MYILIRITSKANSPELVSHHKYKLVEWLKSNGYHYSEKLQIYINNDNDDVDYIIETIEKL